MDLFNRTLIHKGLVEVAARNTAKDILPIINLEKTQSNYTLHYMKAVLAGPRSSGRTSLLFEVAFQYAEKGHSVLFISPTKISKLPLILNGCESPSYETLKRIKMFYLETKNEFLEFMASVHINQTDHVRLIIVDDIDFYYRQNAKQNELAGFAKIYAFLLDAVAFLSQPRNNTDEKLQQCSVACSMLSVGETSPKISNKSALNMWFNDFITLKAGQTEKSFMLQIEEEGSNEQMKLHSLEYVITDQKIEFYTS